MKSNYLTFNKMKKTILLLAMGVALTTQTLFAQVPSYVPTNGLVGYWPFNGNANDVSGNGNNGIVTGATLTTDRYSNNNNAYSFGGDSNYITVTNSPTLNSANKTISVWVNFVNEPTNLSSGAMSLVSKWYSVTNCNNQLNDAYILNLAKSNNQTKFIGATNLYSQSTLSTNYQLSTNTWYHVVFTHDATSGGNIYVNGVLISSNNTSGNICSNQNNLFFGADINFGSLYRYFSGKLDDIGMWNRALSQEEITNLYNSISSNECLTMVINTGVLSTNPYTYTSSVSIYPNPANEQITIDCGNLANVVGWNIKITNMLGQEVFNQPMNTQQYVVPLNTWTGQGMYFVKIINAQNEVVNIKKIILQ
jgi:hypothetical protein